ncbi:hypothetical protein LTR91_024824 [Friedmanniomyces endolithicus]|uniref:Uncharacterized protein n=1 Tax=Friedmanniomyces endolithicus TaxID=329885 RepID=A0AAN6H005_9PEZI|nr:hypothetical protein LTR59_008301 [Friedmanniomyces endolithicus]KAK0800352.1 hypothetical protein LTR38_007190 [Friedmanniomyces endolithicus]KAK0844599.1 hypothetical protein LTR03_007929 [Friedmanniomyces endolithicus]KAK0871671.1 hypothetical protein LTS02_001735 [Friedmanniomyces endolithicus]KAK0878856.1 hypothetical protein LTR87_007306 [Friedmanniomyces endolithicus]
MEHFANFMALGVRENERLEREKSARAAKEPSTAAASPPTDNTGTFGRRMSKRHAVEARFNEERRDKGKQSSFYGRHLPGIAELEGDWMQGISERSAAETCVETAKKAMRQEMETRLGAEGGEDMAMVTWDPSLSPLENVTGRTRMHLLGTADEREVEKAARKKQRAIRTQSGPLPNTTTETRMLMVGLISPEEVNSASPTQQHHVESKNRRESKFREQGLGTNNDANSPNETVDSTVQDQVISRKKSRGLLIRAPSLKLNIPVKRLSPRKTITIPSGTRSVSIEGIDFDLIQPVKGQKEQTRTLSIPPRGTSRNYSLPLTAIQEAPQSFGLPPSTVTYYRKVTFMSLPFDVRIKIYNPLVIASHDVFVCQCGLCAWSSSRQPALALATHQIRAEVLPIYYGEHHFMLREAVDWRTSAPIFLRALSPASRNLIKHVEISTTDMPSTICMMASLGFTLSPHRLPTPGLPSEVDPAVLFLTFAAISRRVQAYERLPEIERMPAITLWEGEPRSLGLEMDGAGEAGEAGDEEDGASISSSAGTVGTAIMSPWSYDGVVGEGIAARRVSGGRVVMVE